MPYNANIQLTVAGLDAGPFDLYSDVDNFSYPFETNIPKTSLLAGYVSTLVPTGATIIRVQSNSRCTNYVDIAVSGLPTPTPTPTPTPSPTPTVTSTPTVTPTPTVTSTPTVTPTLTATPTPTPTPTSAPPTPTPTITSTPTVTPTLTPTPTVTPTPTPTPTPTSIWTIRNLDCGFGTINDVGINGNFIGSLSGPSNFPLSSTLYGNTLNPGGINYGGTNTIQVNVTTNLPGTGNCCALRVYINGNPTYVTYFSSNPFPQISGVIINTGDTVEVETDCFVGSCPP